MILLIVLFTLLLVLSGAFLPLTLSIGSFRHACCHQRTSQLSLAYYNHDKDDYESALARNKARTDVQNFLTQRSLQSFLYLLIETRDPHTVTYLEEYFGWRNLENFHGTGALNMTLYPTWDSVLLELIQQPPAVVVIKAKRRGRGHGGWSKNNPYLEERFVEFEIDIDPVSLASRILSVREQLAAEWTTDLQVLLSANEKILASYHDRSDDKKAFDRTALAMGSFGLLQARAPSPLRKGNFDLLVLLATQESIHRVLREYQHEQEQQVSFEWLRDFYMNRVEDMFDGSGEVGRADDFLEELLLMPPSVKKNVGAKQADLIDPLKIAEDVIRMRSQVALDWGKICARVPEDHTSVRKVLMDKQMLKWGNNVPSRQVEVTEETEIKRDLGEFE